MHDQPLERRTILSSDRGDHALVLLAALAQSLNAAPPPGARVVTAAQRSYLLGEYGITRHREQTVVKGLIGRRLPVPARHSYRLHERATQGREVGDVARHGAFDDELRRAPLERYADVIEAYLSGLEAYDGDLAPVHSVASFFVSRVDTEVDRRLNAIGTPDALALRGKAAVAQAKLAYQLFLEQFSGARWERLSERGARVQRPLWASTSTKNPNYPDTLYVDDLIGPDTINTMPESTIEAFEDHGRIARTIDEGVDDSRAVMASLAAVGVDMVDVGRVLEDEGVASFAKSFDELIETLREKGDRLAGTA